MKNKLLGIVLMLSIGYSSYGQWQQCTGTAGLNMQSLLTNGIYNFRWWCHRSITFNR